MIVTLVVSLATTKSVVTLQSHRVRSAFKEALNKYESESSLHRLEASSSQQSESCVGLLQNITNYFVSNNETLEQIIRNSGKDYNDLGRYEDCTFNVEGFHYILVTIP